MIPWGPLSLDLPSENHLGFLKYRGNGLPAPIIMREYLDQISYDHFMDKLASVVFVGGVNYG